MKAFFAVLLVLVLAFAGIKMLQTPSVPAVQASTKHENMTQFSNDVAMFMQNDVAKKMEISKDIVKITAKCKPDQGAYGTRCWVSIMTPGNPVEKATAENVRRRGDKFVWDHES